MYKDFMNGFMTRQNCLLLLQVIKDNDNNYLFQCT